MVRAAAAKGAVRRPIEQSSAERPKLSVCGVTQKKKKLGLSAVVDHERAPKYPPTPRRDEPQHALGQSGKGGLILLSWKNLSMETLVSDLAAELRAQGVPVLTADDGESYESARRVWNGDIDRFPSAIVACSDAASTVTAVQASARRNLPVTVRGGGHNVAGLAVTDGSVVIDMCDRTAVVSTDGLTVAVGGGALWCDVDAATAPLCMHVPAGLISHTGVAGLTLGGGIGWLARMYGLTCDSMVEATLVTASGEVITASDTSYPDVLWGLRGGGGGLGIVTTFVFRLRPVGPTVAVLEAQFSVRRGGDVLRRYSDLCLRAPDELVPYCFVQGATITIIAAFISPMASGVAAVEPTLDNPFFADIEAWGAESSTRRFQALQSLNKQFDQGNRHGRRYRWSRSTFLSGGLSQDVISTVLTAATRTPEGFNIQITSLGGALGRIDPDATAFHHRGASHEVHAIAVADSDDIPHRLVDAVRSFGSTMETYGSAGYVNILASPSSNWLGRAYGAKSFQRLLELKKRFDPGNFFDHNPLGACLRAQSSPGASHQPAFPSEEKGSAFQAAERPMTMMGDSTRKALGDIYSSVSALPKDVLKKIRGGLSLRPSPGPQISNPTLLDQGTMYWCDNCMAPMSTDVDKRYRCSYCNGFDLCHDCFTLGGHPHFLWEEVPRGLRVRTTPGVSSVGDLLMAAFVNNKNRWCLGTVPVAGGERIWATFGDIGTRVRRLGCGFRRDCGLALHSTIGICGSNSEDWVAADVAALVTRLVVVPLDPGAPVEELSQMINLTRLEVVVCGQSCAGCIAALASACPSLRRIVVGSFGERAAGAALDDGISDIQPHLHLDVVPLESVESAGKAILESGVSFDSLRGDGRSDAIATVIFTSGSTGRPKGAQLTDATLARRIGSAFHVLNDPNVIVSYMPPAHSFDRVSVLSNLVAGGRVAFHRGPVATIMETLQEVRPTTFSSTPRLWNTLYQEYQDALRAAPSAKQQLLRQVGRSLGGRIRTIGTGGAKTSTEVVAFLRECFQQCSVADGFGTTETGGVSWDGTPGSHVRIMLLDAPDLGYTSKDQPHPRGELCVSNDAMASGYIGDAEATERAFFTDEKTGVRWYRTGDIVEMRASPLQVVVIDRMKALFKLAAGEFIAPQRLEQLFETSPLIEQCWVTGNPGEEFPVAVIVVGRSAAHAALFGDKHGGGGDGNAEAPPSVDDWDLASACAPHSPLERAVLAVLSTFGAGFAVRPFEVPRGCVLEHMRWGAADGGLTRTFKLRRGALERRYKRQVAALYDRLRAAPVAAPSRPRDSPVGAEGAPSASGGAAAADSAHRTTAARVLAVAVDLKIVELAGGAGHVTDAGDADARAVAEALSAPLDGFLADSLSALRLARALGRAFGVDISALALLEPGATLGAVARRLEGSDSGGGAEWDFETEAVPPAELLAPGTTGGAGGGSGSTDDGGDGTDDGDDGSDDDGDARITAAATVVVLTGATGFVGVFLLVQLLRDLPPGGAVVCPVRCDGTAEVAAGRIAAALQLHDLAAVAEGLNWRARVVAVPADLGHPSGALGLRPRAFAALGAAASLVLHCAAEVNGALPYSRLRAANVDGTATLLRLAALSKARGGAFFAFVSTVGVLPGGAPLPEADQVPSAHLHRAGGYAQSKWVAETMVRAALRAKVLAGCVLRPATVFGSSSSGASNATDFVMRSLCGMAQLRAAPDLEAAAAAADLTPVDELARVIVRLSLFDDGRHASDGKVLNLTAEPLPMAALIGWLRRYAADCGRAIELVSWPEWRAALRDSTEAALTAGSGGGDVSGAAGAGACGGVCGGGGGGSGNPLHPLAASFGGFAYPTATLTLRGNARAALDACGAAAPAPVTEEAARRCFAWLHRTGSLFGLLPPALAV